MQQGVTEDYIINQFGPDKFRVNFVDTDNSTCIRKTSSNPLDLSNENLLKMTYNGDYLWTTEKLKTYYKPRDAFVCCYLSNTYGQLYSDGYGLNFYTHEYGYYEYCDNDTDSSLLDEAKKGGATAAILGIGAAVLVVGAVYMFVKKDQGKDGGEESEEENDGPNITINYVSNTVNQHSSSTNMYSMGGGMMPPPAGGMMTPGMGGYQQQSMHQSTTSTTSTSVQMTGATIGAMPPMMPPMPAQV